MSRKIRSDATLKSVSKRLEISEENFRHPSGRKIRNDKTLKAIRMESEKEKKKK